MTHEEIETWAIDHGFTKAGASRYEATYLRSIITLLVGRDKVTASIENDGQSMQLGKAPLKRVGIEDDILSGVGLGVSFAMRFVKDRNERPAWYKPRHMESLFGPFNDDASTPTPPKP